MDWNAKTELKKRAEHGSQLKLKLSRLGSHQKKCHYVCYFRRFSSFTQIGLGVKQMSRNVFVFCRSGVDIKSVKPTAIEMSFSPSAVRIKAIVRKLQSSNYENYFRPEIVDGTPKDVSIPC
jgi:hypothetical protein